MTHATLTLSHDAAQQEHVCFYVIEFSDGGAPEGQCLCVGTPEDCQTTADLISAVSYSGERPAKSSRFYIRPQFDPPMRAGQKIMFGAGESEKREQAECEDAERFQEDWEGGVK